MDVHDRHELGMAKTIHDHADVLETNLNTPSAQKVDVIFFQPGIR